MTTEKEESLYYHASYLTMLLRPHKLKISVEGAIRSLKGVEYDAIAFSGNSGAIFATALSYATGKPLILVRKPNDNSHSAERVEGYYASQRYIIADDLVCTGTTATYIVDEIKKYIPKAVCIGAILSNDFRYNEEADYMTNLSLEWMRPSDRERLKELQVEENVLEL